MIKRILTLIWQDLLLTIRNGFLWILLGLMAAMVILVNVLPQQAESPVNTIILDQSQGQILKKSLLAQGAKTNEFVSSFDALSNAVVSNRFVMGIKFSGSAQDPKYSMVYQDVRDTQTINTYKLLMDQLIKNIRGDKVEIETILLRPVPKPYPLNLKSLPILMVFEVMILGFLLVAVMIFSEKDEGSIRAYRVSPGGVLAYIISKTVVFTLISLLYGLPIVMLTAGFGINYGQLILILTLSIVLFTLLGLGIAVYFQNISEWFFMGVLVLIINILSQISYMFPTFAPGWIAYLPSYPALFGIQEVLFPSGKTGFMGPIIFQLGSYTVITFIFAFLSVNWKLFKEGK